MIKLFINGDILDDFAESKLDALVHGCNCFHTMGAGIAGQIARRFPESVTVDKQTPCGDWEKIGSYSQVHYYCGTIINGYTQYEPGSCPSFQLYDAIRKLFKNINIEYAGKTVGIPYIGCGIAGGDWKIISEIINQETPNLNIIVYYL